MFTRVLPWIDSVTFLGKPIPCKHYRFLIRQGPGSYMYNTQRTVMLCSSRPYTNPFIHVCYVSIHMLYTVCHHHRNVDKWRRKKWNNRWRYKLNTFFASSLTCEYYFFFTCLFSVNYRRTIFTFIWIFILIIETYTNTCTVCTRIV